MACDLDAWLEGGWKKPQEQRRGPGLVHELVVEYDRQVARVTGRPLHERDLQQAQRSKSWPAFVGLRAFLDERQVAGPLYLRALFSYRWQPAGYPYPTQLTSQAGWARYLSWQRGVARRYKGDLVHGADQELADTDLCAVLVEALEAGLAAYRAIPTPCSILALLECGAGVFSAVFFLAWPEVRALGAARKLPPVVQQEYDVLAADPVRLRVVVSWATTALSAEQRLPLAT